MDSTLRHLKDSRERLLDAYLRAHDEYVERIGRLRDSVVIEIDKLLEESREN
jgi:hypothetical protein